MTNDAYWKLMNFSFVSGRPFSKEEYDAGQQVAVISQSLATKLFPGEDATGKTVDLKFVPFRIVGVVKDVSPVFKEAAGDVWVPITAQEDYTEKQLIAMLRLRDKEDYPALLREIDEAERRFNLANKPWTLSLNAPYSHRTHTMGVDRYVSEKEPIASHPNKIPQIGNNSAGPAAGAGRQPDRIQPLPHAEKNVRNRHSQSIRSQTARHPVPGTV